MSHQGLKPLAWRRQPVSLFQFATVVICIIQGDAIIPAVSYTIGVVFLPCPGLVGLGDVHISITADTYAYVRLRLQRDAIERMAGALDDHPET